jgi:hypothetical protein
MNESPEDDASCQLRELVPESPWGNAQKAVKPCLEGGTHDLDGTIVVQVKEKLPTLLEEGTDSRQTS